MQKRLHGDRDHPAVALALGHVAYCLRATGRSTEALGFHEQALAMQKRVYGDRDHEDVASSLSHVASCMAAIGHAAQALTRHEEALAMWQRLHGDRDHRYVATSLNNVAVCLQSLGRDAEALPAHTKTLAMRKRLHGPRDHPDVASSLSNLAACLESLGRVGEALQQCEEALAIRKRLNGDQDHPEVATSVNNVAACLESLGRLNEALSHYEQTLAMQQRLYRDRDHPYVAASLGNLANCLRQLGRATEALSRGELALAMDIRLNGDRDHPDVATQLATVGACLKDLGREAEALPRFAQALAMHQRLCGGRDHPVVSATMTNVALCQQSLGYAAVALPLFEDALAMARRINGDLDHPAVATNLHNLAGCHQALGRASDALPRFEQALAMRKRLYADRDHPAVATSLNSQAVCLESLGRVTEALGRYEQTLAMRKQLYGDRDHPEVSTSLNNLGVCLESLGRAAEALSLHEQALAMQKRLQGDRDHPLLAASMYNVAYALRSLGRAADALPYCEQALAMQKRLYRDRDHPHVAASMSHIAFCLQAAGRAAEALAASEQALVMWQRLYGAVDHPDVATSLNNVAFCLHALGRPRDAVPLVMAACAMIERLRSHARISPELKQSFFDTLKRGGPFDRLQALTASSDPAVAVSAAERSRSRDLLDLLEQQQFDPVEDVVLRQPGTGAEATAESVRRLREELARAHFEEDRLLHALGELDGDDRTADTDVRRKAILAAASDVADHKRRLSDQMARLLAAVLPVGTVRTTAEICAALRDGELFLQYTIAEEATLLFVFAPDGGLEILPLPAAIATTGTAVPALISNIAGTAFSDPRGRDPESPARPTTPALRSRELFASLVPRALWERIRNKKRVFIALHRSLHRLPFESLVVDVEDSQPIYWLDVGPPIAYVPSGSCLYWLRTRERQPLGEAVRLGVLAVGDPGFASEGPDNPERGVLVAGVNADGEGARVGLQPGDVLTSYDGKPLVDDSTLRELRTAIDAAVQGRRRASGPIAVDVWRNGTTLRIEVGHGLLGIQVVPGADRGAFEASLDRSGGVIRFAHKHDLERIARLPRLAGARAEAEAIAAAFRAKGSDAELLLGAQATEAAVFHHASKAQHVHFACHGIAEEYAGQSLSMLVLSQPRLVTPEDDGLLKLRDLLHAWRGRLSTCDLVVLSACRTNIGPTNRDDSPQALPIGFLFAGVPSVISSLWAVDDGSTRELMTDFYGRLLGGETNKLAAFTAAKKALRAKYPDPFHWAPFLYLGAPE
ncbi:MAG: tetratricopeptide repeat protein [Planctomycetota bacterium]